jgi:hypothetical protein
MEVSSHRAAFNLGGRGWCRLDHLPEELRAVLPCHDPAVHVEPEPRPGARQAIAELREQGVKKIVMIMRDPTGRRGGRRRPGLLRPTRGHRRDPPVPHNLPQDGAEPSLDGRLQRRGNPGRGGRPGLGWVALSPAVGVVLMSASTIVVALNAQLLRRVRLTPGRG